MKIGERHIGPGHPVYIIAEMSGNHGHDYSKAVALVHAAKEAGADAIKLQTYTADTITLRGGHDCFRIKGTIFEGRTLHDLYAEACTPWDWQPKLKQVADEVGLDCFSTPFDFTSVDFLEEMEVPAYKIASFELVDIPLIERVARTGKPLIISTGMGTMEEIEDAVAAVKRAGGNELALLKCTSAVPAPIEEMNLRALPMLADRFGVVTGLSDHSRGIIAPVAAVALGGSIVEKHFKFSDEDEGPDVSFSLAPAAFKEMVEAIRTAEQALGDGGWHAVKSDQHSKQFRRSLFAVADIKKGETFAEANVRSVRPGNGLPPKLLPEIFGKRATRDLTYGTPLTREDIEW